MFSFQIFAEEEIKWRETERGSMVSWNLFEKKEGAFISSDEWMPAGIWRSQEEVMPPQILAFPDPKKQFILDSGASQKAIGNVLLRGTMVKKRLLPISEGH